MADETKEPEKPDEEKPEEKKEDPSAEGSLIQVAERIEKGNAEAAKNNAEARDILREQKELIAKGMLGGVTNAGAQQQRKEETPKEYGERMMKGK